MLVRPSWRNTLIARLRRVAMVRGRPPLRILEASSVNVVSRTWWSWFSIFQWPRIHPANSAPEAAPAGRLVTKYRPLDRDPFAGQVLAPSHDLEGLAGSGVVEVAEDHCLEPADFDAVVAAALFVVVERDVPPRQFLQPAQQTWVVGLHDRDVVRVVLAQPGAVRMLCVGRIGCDHHVLQVDSGQHGDEGRCLIALVVNLALPSTVPVRSIAAGSQTAFPPPPSGSHAGPCRRQTLPAGAAQTAQTRLWSAGTRRQRRPRRRRRDGRATA